MYGTAKMCWFLYLDIVPASEQQWGKREWSQRCFTGQHRLFSSALPRSPFPGSWCVCRKITVPATAGTTLSLRLYSHFFTAATLSDGRGQACCSWEENIIYKDHWQASKETYFSFSRRTSPNALIHESPPPTLQKKKKKT